GYLTPKGGLSQKALLTITAPADAPVGTVAPFRVVGRAEVGGKPLEHLAQPQALYGGGPIKRMHLRHSPGALAAVAPPLDCRPRGDAGEGPQDTPGWEGDHPGEGPPPAGGHARRGHYRGRRDGGGGLRLADAPEPEAGPGRGRSGIDPRPPAAGHLRHRRQPV